MWTADDRGHDSAFEAIIHAIETKRTKFDEIFDYRIKNTKRVFKQTLRCLESVLNPNETYKAVDHLNEVIDVLMPKGIDSYKKDIRETISYLGGVLESLDELKENPAIFYEKEDQAQEMFNLFEKMSQVYAIKILPVI